MRLTQIVFPFILFLVSLSPILAQENLEISLKHTANGSRAMRSFGDFIKDTKSFQLDTGGFESYGVWKFSFDGIQLAYNKYMVTKSANNASFMGYSFADGKIMDLVRSGLDNAVYVFTGIKRTGEYVFIPDKNFNKSFLDDSVYISRVNKVPIDSVKILEKILPVVNFKIKTWNNDRLKEGSIYIKFIPKSFFGNLQVSLGDSTANRLNLCAAAQDNWEGVANISNKSHKIYIQNQYPDIRFINNSVVKLFVESSDKEIAPDSIVDDYVSYKLNDSIPISGNLYGLEHIDRFGNFVTLKYLGRDKGIGTNIGFFAKNIIAEKITTNKVVKLSDFRGQYVLLDFWGTWCVPCKKIIPKLLSLNKRYQSMGLNIISVAYDDNEQIAKKMIKQEGMSWTNIFQSTRDKSNAKIIQDYKIETFPTTILIDPKGKILAREEGIDGFEKLYKLIQNTL